MHRWRIWGELRWVVPGEGEGWAGSRLGIVLAVVGGEWQEEIVHLYRWEGIGMGYRGE